MLPSIRYHSNPSLRSGRGCARGGRSVEAGAGAESGAAPEPRPVSDPAVPSERESAWTLGEAAVRTGIAGCGDLASPPEDGAACAGTWQLFHSFSPAALELPRGYGVSAGNGAAALFPGKRVRNSPDEGFTFYAVCPRLARAILENFHRINFTGISLDLMFW